MSGLKLKVVDGKPAKAPLGRTIIKVIGAGGGGCNALDHMIAREVKGVDFIAINTDMQALESCKAPTRIALGQKLTGGLGAGGNPDTGARAAQEDRAVLEQYIEGAHMVFLTTGLGGGTGSGSLPVTAEIAKKTGALTVAVVTLPFAFEGSRRMEIARESLEGLRNHADALIVIPNENLLAAADRKATMAETLAKANDLLRVGINGIVDLIHSKGTFNVDFADVKNVMAFKGEALMGQGQGQGDNRAVDALKSALACPLAENADVNGAKGLLVNVTAGDDFSMAEYSEIMRSLDERIDPETVRKMGLVIDPSLRDEVRITLIATGFNRDKPRSIGQSAKPHAASQAALRAVQNIEESVVSDEGSFALSRSGMLSSSEWERMTSGRRNKDERVELDESRPSYLRIQSEGK